MRKNKSDYYVTTTKELANNLRMLREDRDLTQQKIADILEVVRSTYTYYESGKTLPIFLSLLN